MVQEGEVLRPAADNWLTRAIRTLFGWKPGSVRDDLQVVLDASTPDEVGFSAIERTMLRNILGLHERRIADVMVHRADIVAVKRDIPLGELMSLFESAAHSRLVVYNETLDDPEGIVHIRDLLAFMTAKARVGDTGKAQAQEAFPGRASICAPSISRCRWRTPTSSASCSTCRRRCGRSICWRRCRPRASIWRWWSTNMAAPTDWCRSRTSSSRSSARSTTSTTATSRRRSCARRTIPSSRMPAPASTTSASVIGEDFVTGEAGEEVETLGGYLVSHVGRLPVRGEVISGPGNFEIEVLDADPRRVKRLRIAATQGDVPRRAPQRESRRREADARYRHAASQRQCAAALPATEPVRSEAYPSKLRAVGLCDHPGLGLEARRHRAGWPARCRRSRWRRSMRWPVLFVTFPVAVWLIDGAGAGRWRGVPAAAMSGFWFGLGYFVPGLYWIGYAFLVDAPTFAWLMPFAVLGLPAYLRAVHRARLSRWRACSGPRDASRVLALAVSLTISRMAARPSC